MSSDTDTPSDLAVMDVGEYKQKRRAEAILDALEAVQRRDDKARELMVMGEINKQGRDITVLHAVQAAIEECRNLLFTYAKEHAEQVTDGEDNPNTETRTRYADPFWHGTKDNPLGKFEYYTGGAEWFIGLRDLLAAEITYHERWTETVSRRHRGDKKVQRSATHVVPRQVSKRGFRRLMRFLDEQHNLDLVFEDTDKMETWRYYETDELADLDNVEFVGEPEDPEGSA